MEAPTDLRKVELRGEVEREVRAEFEDAEVRAMDRDRAMRAVVISFTALACVLLPLVALILGLSWRIMRWAAGFGW